MIPEAAESEQDETTPSELRLSPYSSSLGFISQGPLLYVYLSLLYVYLRKANAKTI